MTSCMLAGDRRLAPAKRSGMTVLGKVPKPINLPSQKLENQGNDPNVEIVPKGTITWGSRPSSSVTNAWGTASISSLNADGSLGSPGTRPSTAGSDRSHEPSSNAWGQNSRPSSASGILASGQVSASSSRPRSAETRPGSSQLSRFADNSVDKPVAWGPAGTTERLGSVSSKASGFNLSSGDFPTLGSDKNSDTNSQRGNSSQGRPLSSQGRPLSSHNLPTSLSSTESRQHDFTEPHLTGDHIDRNQGTVNTWKADDPQYALHGPPPNMDHWHRDPHQAPPYPNMNIPPPHYGPWHNPQFRPGPADESWYSRGGPPGGPPGGPYRQPVPPGNYPVDYPPGPPRPLYCDPYPRPYMQPDRYMGPNHPGIRPGAYPRPMPHEGFYGPPRPNFYGPADREASLMGMPPPQVHNQYPPQNQNFNPGNFHARPGGYGGNVMNNEQRKNDHPNDNQEQYRVLLKQHDGSERKNDWGTRSQTQETMDFDRPLRDGAFKNTWRDPSKATDEGILKYPEAANAMSDVPQNYPVIKKDPTLLEKVEGLNNKARIADGGQYSSKEKPKAEGVANHEELNVSVDGTNKESKDYRKESENAHLAKQKPSFPEMNESAEKVTSDSPVNTAVVSGKSGVLESDGSADPVDQKAQRTKMREVALQRAKQRQQEEEERTREQKAKALAKLEELNRRTLAETANSKSPQTPSESSEVQNTIKQESEVTSNEPSNAKTAKKSDMPSSEPSSTKIAKKSEVTSNEPSSTKIAKKSEVISNEHSSTKIAKKSDMTSSEPSSTKVAKKSDATCSEPSSAKMAKKSDVASSEPSIGKTGKKPSVSTGMICSNAEANPCHFSASITIGTIEIQHNQLLVSRQSTVVPMNKDPPPPVQEKKKNDNNHHPKSSTSNATPRPQPQPQPQRKAGRSQHNGNGTGKQGSKYHPTDTVMWAPVKQQAKNEEGGNEVHNGSKIKRAEMERYVPKPQQVSVEKGGGSKSSSSSSKQASGQVSNFGWDDNSTVVGTDNVVVPVSYVKPKRQAYKANKAAASDVTGDGQHDVKSQWQPKSHAKQNDNDDLSQNAVPNAGYNRGANRGYNSSNYRNHYDGDRRRNNHHAGDFSEEAFDEGVRPAGSRYRGQGRNYHRGAGHFYARGVGVSARVGNDS